MRPETWRVGAAVLGCALVGAVVGIFAKPPGGVAAGSQSGARASILVTPVNQKELFRARVPTSNVGSGNAGFWRGPGETYAGYIVATGESPDLALHNAVGAADEYARALTRHENKLMLKRSASPRTRELQRSVMREPTRFHLEYSSGSE